MDFEMKALVGGKNSLTFLFIPELVTDLKYHISEVVNLLK
jgi:hypothetical protein